MIHKPLSGAAFKEVVLQGTKPKAYDYKTLADLEDTNFLRVLIFGPPKVGKTGLALGFPWPALADFDATGVNVVKSPWFRKTYPGQLKPDVIRFKAFPQDTDDYGLPVGDVFFKGIDWINQVIKDNTRKTIIVDSLTTVSKAALSVALPAAKKRGRSKTWEHAKTDHLLLLTKQDFGAEMGVMEQLLDQSMKIKNKHFIAVAHEREEKTESGMVSGRSPLLTGDRLRAKVAYWFDEVWHLTADKSGKRILYCQPHGVARGVGSRLGLPATIEDPTYEKIMAALKGG